jgi:hypothetical protein
MGIGGDEVKIDASEAILEISQNRTLMAEKLTKDPPVKPVIVQGLQNVEQVFENYKPEVSVDFQDADGATKKETLHFSNLGDFGIKGITEQSEFLKDNTTQKEEYLKIMKQLKSNKILKTALADADAKKALLDAIHAMIAELKNNK